MYEARRKKINPKQRSTFIREQKLTWTPRITCKNAAYKAITATHTAFRDRAEFFDQLTRSGRNSDLIDFLSTEVVANVILRERLLKGISDDLPMKHDFDE